MSSEAFQKFSALWKFKLTSAATNETDQRLTGVGEKKTAAVRETRQLSMPRCGAGNRHRGQTKFSATFQSLIMRLIYPVTYVTILSYDLLSSWADGEIGPKEEEGVGERLKAANQHACVTRSLTAQPWHICVYKIGLMSKAKIY